jgi:hypothetical protein
MYSKIIEMGYTKYPQLSTIKNAQQGTNMSGNKFLRNIVYYTDGKSTLYNIYGTLDLTTTISSYNILFNPGSTLLIPYTKVPPAQQWKNWRDKGMDQSSIIADPKFIDAAKGNFTLSWDSPALRLGFKQIPFDKIGPYKDSHRASWPIKETY